MAEVEDHVIPIRLDLEHDQHKIKDTFMWNCAGELRFALYLALSIRPICLSKLNDMSSDTVVTPELFAQCLCDDYKVPTHLFIHRIAAAINERVREYQDQVLPMLARDPGKEHSRGKLEKADEIVFGAARVGAASDVQASKVEKDGSEEDTEEIKTESGGDDDRVTIIRGDEGEEGDMDIPLVIGEGEKQRVDLKSEEVEPDQHLERVMTVEEAMAALPLDQIKELRILVKVIFTVPSMGKSLMTVGGHYRGNAKLVGYLRVGPKLRCFA
jgi:SWI/SNF-related matrix-associated actin-dependent regulator of chromatin subfamily B protein 1